LDPFSAKSNYSCHLSQAKTMANEAAAAAAGKGLITGTTS